MKSIFIVPFAAIFCISLLTGAQAATLASFSASAFTGVSFTSAVYEGTDVNAMGDLSFRYWFDEGDYGAYPQDGAKIRRWRPDTASQNFDATESFKIYGATDTPLRSPSGYAATYLLPGLFYCYWGGCAANASNITVTYEIYSAAEASVSVEEQTGTSSATAKAAVQVASGIVERERFVRDTVVFDGASAFASTLPAPGQSKSVLDFTQNIVTRSLTIAPGQGLGLDLYVTDVSGTARIVPEPEIAVMPLPAGLPMLAAALGLLGLVRRKAPLT